MHQALGDERAGDGAVTAASGDQPVQPLGLLARITVGHHAPEQRHCEQVEHTDPDEECACCQPAGAAERQEQPECAQAGDEGGVHEGHDPSLGEARYHPAEQRHRCHHDHQHDHEQRLQPLSPHGDRHLLAYRADHVVGGQHGEEEHEGPQHHRQLAALDMGEAAHGFAEMCGSGSGHGSSVSALRHRLWSVTAYTRRHDCARYLSSGTLRRGRKRAGTSPHNVTKVPARSGHAAAGIPLVRDEGGRGVAQKARPAAHARVLHGRHLPGVCQGGKRRVSRHLPARITAR